MHREELQGAGVYVLTGRDPETDRPTAYVGEAEVLAKRIRSHGAKDFWSHVYVFLSKDDNLTKGHVRYLEGRLLEEAKATGRHSLLNAQGSGARLPESEREDMEVFLEKIEQLLPPLGSELLTPSPSAQARRSESKRLTFEIKGVVAHGTRTPDGFLVYRDSQAAGSLRPSTKGSGRFAERRRHQLLEKGVLKEDGDKLVFASDVEFSSPSGAASVVAGGNSNGLLCWKDPRGRTLKELEGE